MKQHIPNLLTVLRLVLVLPICALIVFADQGGGARWWAVGLYSVALITDYLDGVLARRWEVVSDVGAMLDPIADKLVVALPLIALIGSGDISGVHILAPLIIVYREFFIAGARDYLGRRGIEFPVTFFGKWKTALQLVAVVVVLCAPLFGFGVLAVVVLWGAALFTALSMGVYVRLLVGQLRG